MLILYLGLADALEYVDQSSCQLFLLLHIQKWLQVSAHFYIIHSHILGKLFVFLHRQNLQVLETGLDAE